MIRFCWGTRFEINKIIGIVDGSAIRKEVLSGQRLVIEGGGVVHNRHCAGLYNSFQKSSVNAKGT